METNIGKLDQSLRILVLVLSALYFLLHRSEGIVSTIAGIICIYSFMTALTKYSPVWEILGINTIKKKIEGPVL
ncbi:MAG: YgaP family membrane protein [Bacteroidota bacterium]